MDMVVHEAIRPDPKAVFLPVMRQAPQVELPIRVIAEDRLPLVPPGDYVVQRPGKLDPQRPRHGSIIPQVVTDPMACAATRVSGTPGSWAGTTATWAAPPRIPEPWTRPTALRSERGAPGRIAPWPGLAVSRKAERALEQALRLPPRP